MAIRVTQHRPQREDAKAKELADLKREKNRLEREVKRLRKNIARGKVEPPEPIEESAEEGEDVFEAPAQTTPCVACGYEETREIELIGRLYRVCPICKAKKRLN